MKFILASLYVVILLGCHNDHKTEAKTIKVKTKKEAIIDSIDRNFPDKLFASFKVGMSKKEFEKTARVFEKQTAKRDDFGFDEYYIGTYKYIQIIPEFNKGKLYGIYFNPAPIGYEHYNSELKSVYEELVEDLSKNYFPVESQELPPMLSIEKGYVYSLAKWELKKRIIELSVQASGVNYSLPLHVYDKNISDSLSTERKNEKNKFHDKSVKGL